MEKEKDTEPTQNMELRTDFRRITDELNDALNSLFDEISCLKGKVDIFVPPNTVGPTGYSGVEGTLGTNPVIAKIHKITQMVDRQRADLRDFNTRIDL